MGKCYRSQEAKKENHRTWETDYTWHRTAWNLFGITPLPPLLCWWRTPTSHVMYVTQGSTEALHSVLLSGGSPSAPMRYITHFNPELQYYCRLVHITQYLPAAITHFTTMCHLLHRLCMTVGPWALMVILVCVQWVSVCLSGTGCPYVCVGLWACFLCSRVLSECFLYTKI